MLTPEALVGDVSVEEFNGCKFFCGNNNKIEREIRRGKNIFGEYYYDFFNFSIINDLVAPTNVCFDIGANIGVYSNVLAMLTGDATNIHSFEPVRHVRNKLLANAKLNGNAAIHVNDVALGDAESRMTMFQIKPEHVRGGVSSLVQNDTYKQLGSQYFDEVEVSVTTIDKYVQHKNLQSVDFLKIDVEGFEMNVLRGGRETIARYRPFILLELDFDRHGTVVAREMKDFFRSLEYQAYEPRMKKKFGVGRRVLALSAYNFQESPERRNILLLP